MKWHKIVLIAGIGILLAACSNAEWNKTDKDNLMDRCMSEGGTKSYCKCYLSNAMKAYPNAKDVEELDFEAAVELSINCE